MRLIDADALLAEAMVDGAYGYVDAKQIADAPTISCKNCKYGECREEYLYPYRCKKEKATSYSKEAWMDRVHRGYVCTKWEQKKVTK